jgi:AcrR family transcriptional regulator
LFSDGSDLPPPAQPKKAPRSAKVAEVRTLTADAWADEALNVLAEQGIDRVRVEVLAKHLGVTKGSFYWHFKDRDALLAALLDRWRKRATLGLIERLDEGGESAEARLRKLLQVPIKWQRSAFGAQIELAIRLWARTDSRAARTLEEIDAIRMRYITQLLQQMGHSQGEAHARAVLAYSYLRVAPTLIRPEAVALMRRCENLIIG